MGLKHQFENNTKQGKAFDVNQLDGRFKKSVTHQQAIVPEQVASETSQLLKESKASFAMP
jgi:hypothetical protein